MGKGEFFSVSVCLLGSRTSCALACATLMLTNGDAALLLFDAICESFMTDSVHLHIGTA